MNGNQAPVNYDLHSTQVEVVKQHGQVVMESFGGAEVKL